MNVDPGISGTRLYDAHCHLYDAELKSVLCWDAEDRNLPCIAAHVVNGTHPDNWDQISAFTGIGKAIPLKAYGVHPWRVDALPAGWEQHLLAKLEKDAVSVGEIGLDFWIEPRDVDLQKEVFLRQMEIASDLNLAPSIHCVRAYGALLDCLRTSSIPPVGFLAHGFGGSREVMYGLLDMGGYVSFSAYGAHPGRKRIRDAIRACPIDRLLIETDSPDMVPPEDVCRFPLASETGQRLHHPAELQTAYQWIAGLREITVDKLGRQVEENFRRLFGERVAF